MVGYGDIGRRAECAGGRGQRPRLPRRRPFSAADVYVGSQIGWGMQFGAIEKRPAFERYWARIGEPAGGGAGRRDRRRAAATAGPARLGARDGRPHSRRRPAGRGHPGADAAPHAAGGAAGWAGKGRRRRADAVPSADGRGAAAASAPVRAAGAPRASGRAGAASVRPAARRRGFSSSRDRPAGAATATRPPPPPPAPAAAASRSGAAGAGRAGGAGRWPDGAIYAGAASRCRRQPRPRGRRSGGRGD